MSLPAEGNKKKGEKGSFRGARLTSSQEGKEGTDSRNRRPGSQGERKKRIQRAHCAKRRGWSSVMKWKGKRAANRGGEYKSIGGKVVYLRGKKDRLIKVPAV